MKFYEYLFKKKKRLVYFLQVRGEAEAFAIEAKARAEAEQMSKKADAWRDYQEAAMVDMLLETLPKVSPFVRFSCCSKTKNYFTDFSTSRVLRSIVR